MLHDICICIRPYNLLFKVNHLNVVHLLISFVEKLLIYLKSIALTLYEFT